jgi:hypothetical protein
MRDTLRGYVRCIVAAAVAASGLMAVPSASAQGVANNTILNELLQRGVPFGNNFRRVRSPTLGDGMKAADQQKAIGPVLALKPNPPTYAAFTNANINAPFVMKIDNPDPPFGGANQPGHSIDLWFVVWGKLDAITDPKFLKQQFQPDANDRIDVLMPAELPMGIQTQKIAGGGEWFVHGQFMILSADKRVKVHGTAHTMETTTNDSGTVAAIIDQRFNQNPTFPNEWRPVLRDANGQIRLDAKGQPLLGGPSPYVSAGGYLKATKLIQPAGALLVEYHLVYEEPFGWFGGKNLLRTKLNAKAEDDVRTFRRKVKAASEETAASEESKAK